MSEISLKIYQKDNKKAVEKTYSVDGYDLMFGTLEDFMDIIDVDKLNDNKAVAKMVIDGYGQIKPLLKDIFPELTDEELKRTKVSDIARAIVQMGTAVVENLGTLKQGN